MDSGGDGWGGSGAGGSVGWCCGYRAKRGGIVAECGLEKTMAVTSSLVYVDSKKGHADLKIQLSTNLPLILVNPSSSSTDSLGFID